MVSSSHNKSVHWPNGMRKKRVVLLLGMAALLVGLVFWLVTPSGSPTVPSRLAFSSLDYSIEQNEPTEVAQENPEDGATVIPARVFACGQSSEAGDYQLTQDDVQKSLDSWDRLQVAVAASLRYSENPEHLLTAALIGSDGETKLDLAVMERALNADPDNPLTLWNFLDACSLHPEATMCADGSIEKRAILADGGNGLLWGKIAGYRLERGDTSGAYVALIRANTAPQFNGYFIEHVEMLERGLAAATDDPYLERIVSAIGIAAAMALKFYIPIRKCREQAAESAEWLRACLDFGKRLEIDGRTVMSTLLGIGLQKIMYEMSGDTKKKSDADFRLRLYRNTIKSMNSENVKVVMFYDDQVLADFISEWSAHGELRAHQFVQEEVVRLSKQPGYDPCKRREEKSVQTPE